MLTTNIQYPGSTETLYRPTQVQDAKEELKRLEATLSAPPHIRARISDVGEMRRRRDGVKKELAAYTPQPFGVGEKDAALAEFDRLEGEIAVGMPSSEEMRRNPSGAVSKHTDWEKRNLKKILRLKHVGLRLAAGGDLPSRVKFAGDISNIERIRPLNSFSQLPMDGAQIPKTRDIHIGTDIANAVIFSEEEMIQLSKNSPTLAASLAILPVEMRAALKDLLPKLKREFKPTSRENNGQEAVNTRKEKLRLHPFWKAKVAAQAAGIKVFGRKRADVIKELDEKGVPY